MKNEIALYNYEDVSALVKVLADNGYVAMVSQEEKLWIVNYESGAFSDYWERVFSDRNAVVFMSRDEFEERYTERESEVY